MSIITINRTESSARQDEEQLPVTNFKEGAPAGEDALKFDGQSFNLGGYRLMKRSEITDEWIKWVSGRNWRSMITLTVKQVEMKQDTLINSFYRLIRYINTKMYGDHYTRILGHSYFSYLVGIERQKRGALHLHVLVDRPVPFDYIRKMWDKSWGIGWVGIDEVGDNLGACEYMTKYVAKGGELIPFFVTEKVYRLKPKIIYLWWNE